MRQADVVLWIALRQRTDFLLQRIFQNLFVPPDQATIHCHSLPKQLPHRAPHHNSHNSRIFIQPQSS